MCSIVSGHRKAPLKRSLARTGCHRRNTKRGILILLLAAVVALGATPATSASPITVTFDELFNEPANGLSIMGVTFGFEVGGLPSTDALYGTSGPGGSLSDGSVLGGDAAGILSMEFATPTSILRFAVVLSDFGALDPGYTVRLFDASEQPLGVFPIRTESAPFFSGGIFESPGGLVSRAVVDINETAIPLTSRRFALDNLSFDVPEPRTMTLIAVVVGALVFSGGVLSRLSDD